jgi:hypothetical protein
MAALPLNTRNSRLGAGWIFDEERGGFIPPAGAQGTSMLASELAQGAAPAQDVTPAQLNAPGAGWTYDDNRGGFIPPAGAEGMSTVAGGPVNMSEPDIYQDPVYLRQLQYGQGAFNNARTNALADKERETLYTQEELEGRKTTAEQARRRLAGNYAARGMGGGRSGALSRAEATQNAQELAARTTLRDKISELNRQFVASYGAEGSDWLGTAAGASAQSEAVQAAINARLAGITTVG